MILGNPNEYSRKLYVNKNLIPRTKFFVADSVTLDVMSLMQLASKKTEIPQCNGSSIWYNVINFVNNERLANDD